MEWYTINDIDKLDSPALVVYPERVKENIRLAVKMVDGDSARLRPHIKTHKSPGVTRLLLDAGIHKFKCATIAEAEMLAICGAPDILLAYQPIGPKLQRFISLIRKYPPTKFSCLIDNKAAAEEMDRAFSAAGLNVQVYIDLNLGMNRTGITPGPGASDLYKSFSAARNATAPAASTHTGITPIGLHAYDGHIRETDMAERTRQCNAAFALVENLRDELKREDWGEPIIVAGGSPTFSIHCKRQEVECSPGTFVYWDKGYVDAYLEQHFLPAALVITRVVSLPDNTKLCLDLGHKSVAAENELTRRVHFLNAPGLIPIGQSEEHLVMEVPANEITPGPGPAHKYRIGDLFYGIPFHICPTVAVYERAITITDGLVSGEWINSARDRKITV